jgi:hypothetical protein
VGRLPTRVREPLLAAVFAAMISVSTHYRERWESMQGRRRSSDLERRTFPADEEGLHR